jgi:CRP-like cAMP-binding protein
VDAKRLAAIPAFSGLPDEQLAAVASVASEGEVAEGATVTAEGDFGHALFAIESGTADVTFDGEKIATVGPGAVVGEVAVLTSGRRTATVTATSPMRLIVLFKRDVWALERTAPEAARRLQELVAVHLAAVTGGEGQ